MNDNVTDAIPRRSISEPPPESSVHYQRDYWRAQAQEAWQRVAELEHKLKIERALRIAAEIKAAQPESAAS